MDASVKQCQLCEFKVLSLTFFLKHIRQAHSHQPGFNIVCSLSGCPRQFRNFAVYRNHVYDFHSESERTVQITTSSVNENEEPGGDQEFSEDVECVQGLSKKKAAAMWILKVQETYKLTQSTMDSILLDFSKTCLQTCMKK